MFVLFFSSRIDNFIESEEEELVLDRCNAFIRRLIYQEVRQRWPDKIRLETKTDTGSMPHIVVYKLGNKEDEEQKEADRREKEKLDVQEAVGLSALLRKIADSVRFLIAHHILRIILF